MLETLTTEVMLEISLLLTGIRTNFKLALPELTWIRPHTTSHIAYIN